MQVLALASYPVESAATRFRVEQLLPALATRGVDVDLVPFLDTAGYQALYDRRRLPDTAAAFGRGVARRLRDLWTARRYDAVLVQREAMLAGPPVFEALLSGIGRTPMVLDLDDATWIGYDSPTYGRLARFAKWPTKALGLIDRAAVVTCGSSAIVAFVEGRGAIARLVPPAVDTELFLPRPSSTDGDLLVGWIGTHSTWPYLEPLLATLRSLGDDVSFRLRIIGACQSRIEAGPVAVENVAWSRDREPADFASLDVGLYPLKDDEWARGKSGLKSVQYLASGVPFVASPVGGAGQIGDPGVTHLVASTDGEWREAVRRLLTDHQLRRRMGRAGREHALAHHTVNHAADSMANALREALG